MTQLGRRQFTGLLLGAVFAPFGALARAAIDPAETYVSRIADEVMNLANGGQRGDALLNRFSSLLSRHISLRNIANYALGTYRSQLPAGRREEFYRLVNNYAAALFVFYINDFKGSTLDITSTTKQGNFTVILSAIKGRGSSEPVRWRLTLSTRRSSGVRPNLRNNRGVSAASRRVALISPPKIVIATGCKISLPGADASIIKGISATQADRAVISTGAKLSRL